MADGEFKISLGVKVDTNDIRSQINKSISNAQFKKIKLELNTKRIDSQLNSIRKQIQGLSKIKVNINAGGSGGNGGKGNGIKNGINASVNEANKAYNDLMNLARRINSIRLQIGGLDSSKNSGQIAELSGQLNRLMTDYNNLYNTFTKGLNLNQLNAFENEIRSVSAELDKLRSAEQTAFRQGIDTSAARTNIEALENKLKELQATYQSLSNGLSVGQIDNLTNTFQATTDKISALNEKIADTKANLAKGIKVKLTDGGFDKEVALLESDINKLSNVSPKVQTAMSNVKRALADIGTAQASNNIDALIVANKEYEAALKEVNNQLKINARAEKDFATAQKLTDNRNAFMSNIDAWLTKNSAAVKKFGAEMLDLKAKAKSCDQVTLNHLQNEFRRLDKEAEAAGLKMQTFSDRIKTQFQKYGQYFSVASLVIYATQGLRDMFNQVVAIDSAMTELKKVTDESDASYNQFLTNAASKSKELGTTIDGLVSSTADFARLGYGFKESQGLAEVANVYAVVGDEIDGVEGATQSLVSTLAAFKDEASSLSDTDFAMSIVDKFNEVSNNFAISSGGIGEAMQRSASSLRAANNTIDESIAMITAANEVTQNPEKVGNAMKTISMRIRGAKTE